MKTSAAVVAIGMDPAGQFHVLADVGLAELAAGVGTITGFDGFHVASIRRMPNADVPIQNDRACQLLSIRALGISALGHVAYSTFHATAPWPARFRRTCSAGFPSGV